MSAPVASRRRLAFALTAALAVALAAGIAVAVLATAPAQRSIPRHGRGVLIPAYVAPEALARMAERPSAARMVVVNPDNGPGPVARPALRSAVAALRRSGTRVLGYVHTGYGTRDPDAVLADAQKYRSWYDVAGLFVDETAHDRARLPYYRSLTRRARAAGVRLIALNPGTVPAPGYFALGDVVVTFEGPYPAYGAALRHAPAWLRRVPRGRVVHLVYGASRAQALRAAVRDASGFFYATERSLPDPWSTLPAYLGDLERRLAITACPHRPRPDRGLPERMAAGRREPSCLPNVLQV